MCEDCKHYEKKNMYFGECHKIRMMLILENPAPEFSDIESHTKINVRKEFKCNQFQD